MILITILKYLICGLVFSAGFELLMWKVNTTDRSNTSNWQRMFWVIAWPYLIIKFFSGYFNKD
jgi:hypothetical protein|tara:strand:- start:37 stop:225 length:189 start_codon:yes stop_codon:yes gene_type:complete